MASSNEHSGGMRVRLRLEAAQDLSLLLDVPARVRPYRDFWKVVKEICGAEAIERVTG
jgi:hypothetical protein